MVYRVPDRQPLGYEASGDYTQVRLEPFQMFTMLMVEYA
jgi:hypothetical protein